jgi:hypothetical protein
VGGRAAGGREGLAGIVSVLEGGGGMLGRAGVRGCVCGEGVVVVHQMRELEEG